MKKNNFTVHRAGKYLTVLIAALLLPFFTQAQTPYPSKAIKLRMRRAQCVDV